MYFININFIFSAHGFGINTNILETNVINLAVVIAVVITFVGDAIKDLLADRKATILENLYAADQRAQEIQDKMTDATTKLETAKQKAIQIRQQGEATAKEEQSLCITKTENETTQLKQRKEDNLRLQQQKAIQEISKQIIALSVKKARKKASKRTKIRRFQLWVNKARFVHYRTVDKYIKNLV